MVHSDLNGVSTTLGRMRAAGLSAEVTERRWVALWPVLRARRTRLHEKGMLGPDGEKEELVVNDGLRHQVTRHHRRHAGRVRGRIR